MRDDSRPPYDDDYPGDDLPELPEDDGAAPPASPPDADDDAWTPLVTRSPFDDEDDTPPAFSGPPPVTRFAPGEPPAPMSRARERQMRRRQAPMAQQRGPRPPRQIQRPERMKLPQIQIPRVSRTLIAAIGALVLIALIVIVLGRVRNNPSSAQPNAVWLGTEWTYDQPGAEQIAALAERLRRHEIGTVYAWVSWLQSDSTWRGSTNFGNVAAFVSQFRTAYPDAEILGWVSLPVEDSTISYRLDDAAVRQSVAEFSQRVVSEMGFDGVFLNVEPVWNNNQDFLDLLREVRTALGPNTTISAAIPPDWSPLDADIPVPPLIVPGTVWERTYKQSVSLLVDEMVIMSYNSGLSTAADYQLWFAHQVTAYAEAVSELGEGTVLLFGLPTYDEALPGHDPKVENVTSGVGGYRLGLQQAGDAAGWVRGVAIYADWTTSEDEWQAFDRAWNAP